MKFYRPSNIPFSANLVYKDKGWKCNSDFLGYEPGQISKEECVITANTLAKEHDGFLPTYKWLNENGYRHICDCKRKHPKLFENIKQKRIRKTVEEHVFDAKYLIEKNDGIFPSALWLTENGYIGLNDCVRNYPKRFPTINRIKTTKTLEEWVIEVEALAKDHNGILPSQKWLIANGYGCFCTKISKFPKKFKHIKQKSEREMSIENHVSVAKCLAKENGGVLPGSKWLQENGYQGTYVCMRRYPEKFLKITKESEKNKKSKSCTQIAQKHNRRNNVLEKHILTVGVLIKENDGFLPSRSWLFENGYKNLYGYMRKNNEFFPNIKQRTKRLELEIEKNRIT